MKTPAEHSAEILRAFAIEPKPIDKIIASYYRRHRELGSKNRRAISQNVYEAIRAKKMPDFIYERLVKFRGEEYAAGITSSLNGEAQVITRANTLKIGRDELISVLAKEGIVSHPTKFSPYGLYLAGRKNLNELASFKAGFFEVQEEASQLISILVNPKESETIIDLCAGAGGKSLTMAQLMKNKGRIIASDIDKKRLKAIYPRAKRAGVTNIETVESGLLIQRFSARADAVLIDAPCSGTGTLRRNPDLKWRLKEEDIEKYVSAQKQLLAQSIALLKDEGRIIYATCSILPQENEEVVDWFMKKFPHFVAPEGCFKTDPSTYPIDGFFGCVLMSGP